MILIVCLGNPGKEYQLTRHNAGFLMGDYLISAFGLTGPQKKHRSLCWAGSVAAESVVMLYPQTFMNLSGEAMQAAMAFYKLPLSKVVVIYDDLDIPFGTIRVRPKGSAGTHNGMKSIVEKIGSEFARIRIGIGPKPEGWETTSFVLGNFTPEEQSALPDLGKQVVEIVRELTAADNHPQRG